MAFAIVAVVLVAVVVAGTVIALRNRRSFAEANQVVPGVATRAPASWAGSHAPEARLHRRLRDAVTALRTHPVLEEVGLLELRVSIEQEALAVDERLIAAAALPDRVRAEPLARVTEAVEAIEEAVARIVDAGGSTGVAVDQASLQRTVEDLTHHLDAIAEARAELDAGEQIGRDVTATTEPAADPEPAAETPEPTTSPRPEQRPGPA